jgi:16S rRNA (cytidine1402-2'-O)-methyltransferase
VAKSGTGEAISRQPQQMSERVSPGTLYVVATPLGNLDDLTKRAREVLASVDRILAEDTRVTATLLAHCGIAKRATALHAHNEAARIDSVLSALDNGESVAIVSDAGTPAISDPGARLVRAAHDRGHAVVPIPGPSAVATAISAAGLSAERFLFVGFLPAQAKARGELLASIAPLPVALVIYEAPHRVRDTVAQLARALGGARTVVVCRELTKKFEQIARMPLASAEQWIAADANRERGELVLVVDADERKAVVDVLRPDVERWLAVLCDAMPPAAAARLAAEATGMPRDTLYARAVELKQAKA